MSVTSIHDLTDYCLLEIFEHLPLRDQCYASKVCRRWEDLLQRFFMKVCMLYGDGCEWKFKMTNNQVAIKVRSVSGMELVLKSCRNYIKKLKVNAKHTPRNPIVFQETMQVIAVFCNSLLDIDVMNLRDDVSPRILPAIVRQNKSLTSLKLKEISTGVDLDDYIEYLPTNLRDFHLHTLESLESCSIIELLSKLKNLRSFAFNHVPDIAALFISSQKHLESLRIRESFIFSDSFDHLANLTTLVYLDIAGSTHIEDENLIKIADHCKQLKYLIINFCNRLTNVGISGLVKLEKLKYLKMKELDQVTDVSIAMLPETLQMLCCCGCENILDDGVIQLIKKTPDLSILHINNSEITNETIKAAIKVVKVQLNNRLLKIFANESKVDLDMLDEIYISQLTELSKSLEIHLE